jgi:very-short-patch-repair endonuclease
MSKFSSLKIESALVALQKEAIRKKQTALNYKREKKRAAKGFKKPYVSDFKPYADKDLAYFINDYPQPKKIKKKPAERQSSLGEQRVADWLVKNGIRFKREKQFDDLINPHTTQKLWIDFYLHSHKIVIEFDGRQHFKASKMFDQKGDTLERRQLRDKIKDDYCVQKGFTMIRIKYFELDKIPAILSPYFNL